MHRDVHRGFFELGVGHLRGHGAFPDQLVQALLVALAADLLALGVGGADRFVGFLGAFATGLVTAQVVVARSELLDDLVAERLQGGFAEVGRIGAHVGDEAAFVKLLGDRHGAADREAELAARLLLERGGGERRGGLAPGGPHVDLRHLERRADAALEEGFGAVGPVEALGAFGLEGYELALGVFGEEQRGHLEIRRDPEVLDLAFAFDDKHDGDRLHAAGRELALDLFPQQAGKLPADQAVEHAARLLGVDEVHIDRAGLLHGALDGRLGDLAKNDALGVALVETEHLAEVPGNGFALAVFVGGEPHFRGAAGGVLELADHFVLIRGNDVVWAVVVENIDAEVVAFFEVADVAVGAFDGEICAEKFLDGFGLGRRFDDQ
jgi:hypothetical protein